MLKDSNPKNRFNHSLAESRILSVAPMMKITNRHFRFLLRLISKKSLLYSEMIPLNAITKGNRLDLLAFDRIEKPLALQIGGNNPQDFLDAALIAEQLGYDEININVGCPSPSANAGDFGLCLLKKPKLVAKMIETAANKVSIPITVKTRIAVDQLDSLQYLINFIDSCQKSGCQHFIIHARGGILNGLNAKQNRSIPPLNYQRVFVIKQHFPNSCILLNGGIGPDNLSKKLLNNVDGVMIGRAVAKNPLWLAEAENILFNQKNSLDFHSITNQYLDYIMRNQDAPRSQLLINLYKLFYARKNSKKLRFFINQNFSSSHLVESIRSQLSAVN